MVTARPFRPYVITLANGQSFTIRHPELVSCDARGRGMQINTSFAGIRQDKPAKDVVHREPLHTPIN
jgi:hypothetical protein